MMNRRFFAALITLVLMFSLSGCTKAPANQPTAEGLTDGQVVIHFIDVGQGDCEFVELPGGKAMLIDAGEREKGSLVCKYINNLGYTEITYLVATHPHSDHIGGMDSVLKTFDIGQVFAPLATSDTKTYERFLEDVKSKNLKITQAVAGKVIAQYSGLEIDILSPTDGMQTDELNDMSAVVRLTYGGKTVLFAGDAGYDILKKSATDIDILKVSHHGSETGTDKALLNKLLPEYAVISCGHDNSYNHPNADVVKLLKDVKLYRTDIDSTVVATIDSSGIHFDK